jgi:hypothetical protein
MPGAAGKNKTAGAQAYVQGLAVTVGFGGEDRPQVAPESEDVQAYGYQNDSEPAADPGFKAAAKSQR